MRRIASLLRHLEKKVGWVQGFTGELTRNLPLTSTTILNDMDLTHMTLRDIHSIVRFWIRMRIRHTIKWNKAHPESYQHLIVSNPIFHDIQSPIRITRINPMRWSSRCTGGATWSNVEHDGFLLVTTLPWFQYLVNLWFPHVSFLFFLVWNDPGTVHESVWSDLFCGAPF